jgi:hypothetical protein
MWKGPSLILHAVSSITMQVDAITLDCKQNIDQVVVGRHCNARPGLPRKWLAERTTNN